MSDLQVHGNTKITHVQMVSPMDEGKSQRQICPDLKHLVLGQQNRIKYRPQYKIQILNIKWQRSVAHTSLRNHL